MVCLIAKQGTGSPAGDSVSLWKWPVGDEPAAERNAGPSQGGAENGPSPGWEEPTWSREVNAPLSSQSPAKAPKPHRVQNALFSVCAVSRPQAGGGPPGAVVGGETQAAGAVRWAAAEIRPGQRETAEGSSGPEKGTAAPSRMSWLSAVCHNA